MKVTVGDSRLFFDVTGLAEHIDGRSLTKRPTLILLHGTPGNSDHSVFTPVFDQLADVAQIIYLDMRGCGRSDDPAKGEVTLEGWADDIAEFCDVLGIDRPIVLGHSAGGMVAAAYAVRHPDHPRGVVLSSTHAKLSVNRCLDMFFRLGGAEAQAVARRALVESGDLDSWIEYGRVCMPLYNPTPRSRARHVVYRRHTADVFHSLGGIWHQLDLLNDLHTIVCPTLVIAGELDPVTPFADSEDIASRIDSQLVRFERFQNAGHGVWIDDQPRAMHVLREFITSIADNNDYVATPTTGA